MIVTDVPRQDVPGRRTTPQPVVTNIRGVDAAVAERESAETSSVADQQRAEITAAMENLLHRGYDEVVDVVDYVLNPGVGVTNVIAFTVPSGSVAKFTKLAVQYTEPIAAQLYGFGAGGGITWRLLIDNNEVPQMKHFQVAVGAYGALLGDLYQPFDVTPVFVQASQTITIQINVGAAWDLYNLVAARLSGRLYRPASPSLLAGGG